MGFFAIVNAYTMRISLSLAITEMVTRRNHTTFNISDACPAPDTYGGTSATVTVSTENLRQLTL